mmetsp:Transcript_1751/g.1472  ORF Transcript_1751/g.1472 Transcript_1751/m.1472 type:complete len:100 (+) Transcript_1751:75-374(+)
MSSGTRSPHRTRGSSEKSKWTTPKKGSLPTLPHSAERRLSSMVDWVDMGPVGASRIRRSDRGLGRVAWWTALINTGKASASQYIRNRELSITAGTFIAW